MSLLIEATPYQGVTPHVWASHVTHMNESRLTCENDMSQTPALHLFADVLDEPRTMSHIPKDHATRTEESCRTHKWVISHIWIRHLSLSLSLWLARSLALCVCLSVCVRESLCVCLSVYASLLSLSHFSLSLSLSRARARSLSYRLPSFCRSNW